MCLFDWDEKKNAINIREHGISFEDASLVFEDPNRFTVDDLVIDGEQRWRTVGIALRIIVILVVHLEDDFGEDIYVRLVSHARRFLSKGPKMTKTVRRTSGTPGSAETIERLKRLVDLPDSAINTSDIPPSSFKGARRKINIDAKRVELQKAS